MGRLDVTGKRVPARHMGNLPLITAKIDELPPARASLEGQFDLSGYLTPYSDIVALMVLDHQAHFSNLVTRATWEARLGQEMRIAEAAQTIADYLLFVDEAPITDGPIVGSSGFAEKFEAQGRKDGKGRSLRELDLKTRLLEIPAQLHDLLAAIPGLARGAEEPGHGTRQRCARGKNRRREVCAPHARDSRGHPRNPASDFLTSLDRPDELGHVISN